MRTGLARDKDCMKYFLLLFLKGVAMGAANVVPGVSGGTIALITGIYERLINAIKKCDITAIRLLLRRDFKALWTHIDGSFLTAIVSGVVISIVSLAKVLEVLLRTREIPTMAFFFGLIILSLYFVGKTVRRWSGLSIGMLCLGALIATGIAFLAPAGENNAAWYVFICGIVAICSMILPGLSGSFILIIMGNYALVLGAISSLQFSVLLPLLAGCAFGLVAFSHLLSWIFKNHHDATIALMTGFILGSLFIIWPWKHTLTEVIARPGKEAKEVVVGYDWFLPSLVNSETWIALALMLGGALTIWLMQHFADAGPQPVKAS